MCLLGLEVAQLWGLMRPFTKLNPPTGPAATQDAFADLAPESAVKVDARENRDWFSEFPEEKPAGAAPAQPLRTTPAAQRKSSFFTINDFPDEKA